MVRIRRLGRWCLSTELSGWIRPERRGWVAVTCSGRLMPFTPTKPAALVGVHTANLHAGGMVG